MKTYTISYRVNVYLEKDIQAENMVDALTKGSQKRIGDIVDVSQIADSDPMRIVAVCEQDD